MTLTDEQRATLERIPKRTKTPEAIKLMHLHVDAEVHAAVIAEARARRITTRGLVEMILEDAIPALTARRERLREIRELETRLAKLRAEAHSTGIGGLAPHVAQIVELYNAGVRPRDIAERLGKSQHQVSRIVTRMRATGRITHPPRRAGRNQHSQPPDLGGEA